MNRWTAPARASERSKVADATVAPETPGEVISPAVTFPAVTYAEVWRCCAGLVGRRVADDLTRATLAQAGASRATGADRADRVALLRLACTTCAGLLVDRHRLRGRWAWHRRSAQPTAARLQLVHERPVTVHDLLEAVTGPSRTAFVLTQLVGLDYATAALVGGTDTATVRRQVAAARIELLDHLDRHEVTAWARRRGDGAHGH